MPELRKDPTSSRWVVISTERAKRPGDFSLPPVQKKGGFCPFCTGNETATPPEVYSVRSTGKNDEPGWSVRVVPNKFPALGSSGEPTHKKDGIFEMINGVGVHEVIVETPRHDFTLADVELADFANVVRTYKKVLTRCREDARIDFALLFRNNGLLAGASLEHPHSQLIGLPVIPEAISDEIETAKRHRDSTGTCIFCDMIKSEIERSERIIAKSESFVAISPYAPRFPFETWVFPIKHMSDFDRMDETLTEEFSALFKGVLGKMKTALNDPPYNFMLHTAPFKGGDAGHFHWHFEITPCLTNIAGFERGSHYYINPVPPEEAAKCLRG